MNRSITIQLDITTEYLNPERLPNPRVTAVITATATSREGEGKATVFAEYPEPERYTHDNVMDAISQALDAHGF